MLSFGENENTLRFILLFQNVLWFLSWHFTTVRAQCENGLESSCRWMHDPKTALLWKMKTESGESFVELSKCIYPNCGIGIIESPWLPPRNEEVIATIGYKIYGTSSVYLRLNMNLDDTLTPTQIFSKNGNYAYGYPENWTTQNIKLPATHTRSRLSLKAYVPYKEAMVAVKDINLDGTVILSSTSTSTTSTTTTTSTTSTTRTNLRIPTSTTSTTTTTTTTKPVEEEFEEEEEISPTAYIAVNEEINTVSPETSNEVDYFPDVDDEDDEDERRFQALEVENFIGEEDLTKGYTTVVEPQLCLYK